MEKAGKRPRNVGMVIVLGVVVIWAGTYVFVGAQRTLCSAAPCPPNDTVLDLGIAGIFAGLAMILAAIYFYLRSRKQAKSR